MMKTLNQIVIGTALVGTLLASGCASNKSYSRGCNTSSAYSQQIPKKEADFQIRLKGIMKEEKYGEQFGFIEEDLISCAPRTEKERIALREKVNQIDSSPLNNREKRIIERFSRDAVYPIERVLLRAYGLPLTAKSRIYLNRCAAERFLDHGFK
ncbi:MAG: hypothetical protein AABX07_01050 [Nanoarchaeota archaeon]|mgnify:CR=1 FL=1